CCRSVSATRTRRCSSWSPRVRSCRATTTRRSRRRPRSTRSCAARSTAASSRSWSSCDRLPSSRFPEGLLVTDVTLVGAGALGQGLAALLARNGEVSLLARRAPAQQLLAVGSLTVRLPEGETQVALGSGSGKIRVLTDPEEIDPQAAVVLTPKGHN